MYRVVFQMQYSRLSYRVVPTYDITSSRQEEPSLKVQGDEGIGGVEVQGGEVIYEKA